MNELKIGGKQRKEGSGNPEDEVVVVEAGGNDVEGEHIEEILDADYNKEEIDTYDEFDGYEMEQIIEPHEEGEEDYVDEEQQEEEELEGGREGEGKEDEEGEGEGEEGEEGEEEEEEEEGEYDQEDYYGERYYEEEVERVQGESVDEKEKNVKDEIKGTKGIISKIEKIYKRLGENTLAINSEETLLNSISRSGGDQNRHEMVGDDKVDMMEEEERENIKADTKKYDEERRFYNTNALFEQASME
ncbi:hypothetical protein AX774_g2540 [Zancudomyces culisetae]|uniref:Uncharacterized protein n=1 Tax=Zancudomyces culisetae TaxID=1213189 RepID=A0A1R1PSL2_ZANCU|nr:hypothetical protein AX774_g2540 [Zancudomyces culisetae]|eukprot:OMH83948.1 hypothetical protein AX774_g2540 [Zancudomyces culisetae]